MSNINKINSSWPLYSTNYYPMLRYRKYDNIPIYENCEFTATVKITINDIPYFCDIYVKYNETTHVIKQLRNDKNMIDWEIIENGEYFVLMVKGLTTNSKDYIQVDLNNYRNIGFVELLNYKEPYSIGSYTKMPKLIEVDYIKSGAEALKFKKIGEVIVYNQQYNISKFIVLQNDVQRTSVLYGEFILRVINGTPVFILGEHSADFTSSLINIHAVKNGSTIELYWENKYSSITNRINIIKVFDMNSSHNYFNIENITEMTDSLDPTISLL